MISSSKKYFWSILSKQCPNSIRVEPAEFLNDFCLDKNIINKGQFDSQFFNVVSTILRQISLMQKNHHHHFKHQPDDPPKTVTPVVMPAWDGQKNWSQTLPFSNCIQGIWVRNYQCYQIKQKTIAINLGSKPFTINAPPLKQIHPRHSTILQNVQILNADQVLLFPINEALDFGKVILEPGWNQLGEIADFSKAVALYKSTQYDIGFVEIDPVFATGQDTVQDEKRRKKYNLKVNLWYCPSKTDCLLHKVHATPHDFLEVHTQIYGIGRMQKFHDNDFKQIYQDDILAPGNTHVAYAGLDKDGEFVYPWHQYYGDTECIWIANEFHVCD